jgi:cytochrome c553
MRVHDWFRYGFALPCAVLLIVPAAHAGERAAAPAIVTRYCSGCHGIDGNSQLPYIPRLAGLKDTYLERKLASYRGAGRPPVDEAVSRVVHIASPGGDAGVTAAARAQMVGVANAVSREDLKAAVRWFAAQAPARGKGARGKVVEEGRSLFVEGRESQGLAACRTCHGAEAQGTGIAPRLAGQNAAYIMGQLDLFRTRGSRNSPEMTGIARALDAGQARAVAIYVQSR